MKKLVSLLNDDVLLFLQFITMIMGAICVVYLSVKLWKDNKGGD